MAVTDVRGFARGFGAFDPSPLSSRTINIVVSALNHPNVPTISGTRVLGPAFRPDTLGPTQPTMITLGVDAQPVSNIQITLRGSSCEEFITTNFQASISQNSSITFREATFSSSELNLVGTLSIQGRTISGNVRNVIPLQPVFQNGTCIQAAEFALTLTLTGVLVDVPDDGTLLSTHADGHLKVQVGFASQGTVAFFEKSLAFAGSVIPAGNDILAGGLAGVYCIDSEHVHRTLISNPGLIPQDESGDAAGTFHVRLADKDVEFTDQMKVKLESLTANGQPPIDPSTGQAFANTTIFLGLRPSTVGQAHVAVSSPVVAVNNGFFADEAFGGASGQLVMISSSSIPADGMTQARIKIRVTYPDGTPAPDATVMLDQPSTPGVVVTSAALTDDLGET